MNVIFQKLNQEYLEDAVLLCDQCVGKNLYTAEYIQSLLDKPDHYFYLLLSPEGKAIAYIYFFCTDIEEAARISNISVEQIAKACGKQAPVIGNLQSIGISMQWRGLGLSNQLISFSLEQLHTKLQADMAFGICWKPKGTVPMASTLSRFNFQYLTDAHGVWYEKDNLVCPYCEGRCLCDAAIYYKLLSGE